MRAEVDRDEAPFYFLKPANALVASGNTVPYPPGTTNYHYEIELVVAISGPVTAGDRIEGAIDRLESVTIMIGKAE